MASSVFSRHDAPRSLGCEWPSALRGLKSFSLCCGVVFDLFCRDFWLAFSLQWQVAVSLRACCSTLDRTIPQHCSLLQFSFSASQLHRVSFPQFAARASTLWMRFAKSSVSPNNKLGGWNIHPPLSGETGTYSYRNASMGFNRAALIAGSIPLTIPTKTRITVATTSVLGSIIRRMSAASAFFAIAL